MPAPSRSDDPHPRGLRHRPGRLRAALAARREAPKVGRRVGGHRRAARDEARPARDARVADQVRAYLRAVAAAPAVRVRLYVLLLFLDVGV